MTSAPAKKWEPYGGGYDPKKRGAPAQSDPKKRGAPAQSSSVPAQSYTPPTGYVPSAPAAAPMSTSPAKKWEPYNAGGYDPSKTRDGAADSSAAAQSYLSAQIKQLNENLKLTHKGAPKHTTKRSDEIFNIVFNCLIISQVLCEVGGGCSPAKRFPGQFLHDFVGNGFAAVERFFSVTSQRFASASTRDERMQEIFNLFFSCVILAQTIIHQQLARGAGAALGGVGGVSGVANSVSPINRHVGHEYTHEHKRNS